MITTIARSSKDVKKCIKCKQDIYTFETRKNLKYGKAKHLQCPEGKKIECTCVGGCLDAPLFLSQQGAQKLPNGTYCRLKRN